MRESVALAGAGALAAGFGGHLALRQAIATAQDAPGGTLVIAFDADP